MATPARTRLLNTMLAAASAAIGYMLVEAAYRYHQYHGMADEIVAAAVAQIPRDGQSSSVYDPFTGYRYRPNIEVGPATRPFPVHYKTNRHGLIAREDFAVAKPADEFRIGVVGDSFTANVTSTLRWTDVLEDALNSSAQWRELVGGQRTRVINFGLDGIGTVQFGAVVEHIALPFEPDLLVVNMIRNDLVRKPHVRGYRPAIRRQDISDFVHTHIMTELDWSALYPEVLAVVAGPRFGLAPRLTMRALETALARDIHYADAGEAADVSAAALDTILKNFPAAVFLLDTTYPEYVGTAALEPTARLEDEVFDEIRARFPAIRWINVIAGDRLPASRSEIERWFNLPADQHKNDVGVRVYGEAVAAFLTAHRRGAGR